MLQLSLLIISQSDDLLGHLGQSELWHYPLSACVPLLVATFLWVSGRYCDGPLRLSVSMMQSDFIGDILIFGLGAAAPLSAPSLHRNQMFNIG